MGETWFLRMSTLQLLLSRAKGLCSSLTGVQLVSRLALTISLPQLSLGVISPRYSVLCACCPTLLLSLRLGLDWTISLTSCMPRERLFTGMLEKAWKRENFPKLGRIWPPLKRITKK